MTTNRRTTLIGLGAAALLMSSPARGEAAPSPFPGSWIGTLEAGPVRLRLKLDISRDFKAVVTSLDQGNAVIPAASVKTDGRWIALTFPLVGASFDGKLDARGALAGTFTQGGQPLLLTFTRTAGSVPIVAIPSEVPPIVGPLTLEKLRAHRLALGTPGMAAGWQRGAELATVIADGLRSAQAPIAVTADDRWHIGSITKSMTAFIAARAVEAGVLNWDSSIGSVLGKRVADIHADFAKVTLLHLLSHRSGLPGNAAMADLAGYANGLTPGVRDERLRLAQSVLSAAPAASPGSNFEYANAGYVVAGAMLEVLTGKPWEVLMREQLFKPLGLRSAGIGLPGRQGKIDQPMSHRIAADGKREAHFTDLPAVLGPAGLTHMNIADLLKYLAAHRDQPARLLTPESWKALHTPPFGGNYALGWVATGDRLFHNGSNGSWLAEVAFDRKAGVVAAFASNDAASMRTSGWVLMAAGRAAIRG